MKNVLHRLRRLRGRVSPKLLIGVAILIVLGGIGFVSLRARALAKMQTSTTPTTLVAQADVNLEFTFEALLPNQRADEVALRLVSAEKRTEILVQGKPAQTKGDKVFLVLNLEIDNSDTLSKYMSPVDVFRLVTNDGRLFAADVHSDMLEIQPLSTKLNKIAFVVDANQNEFNLKAGELAGEKQDIQIVFN